jgi:signal transduction histidine kinase
LNPESILLEFVLRGKEVLPYSNSTTLFLGSISFQENREILLFVEEVVFSKGELFKRNTELFSHTCFFVGDYVNGNESIYRFLCLDAYNTDKISFRRVLDAIPADIVVFDKHQRYSFANRNAIKDKKTRDWIIGKDDFQYCSFKGLPKVLAERRREVFLETVKQRKPLSITEKFEKEGSPDRYHLRIMNPIFESDGRLSMVLGYGLEVTELINNQNKLESNRQLLSAVYDATNSLLNPFESIVDLIQTSISRLVNSTLFRSAFYFESQLFENAIEFKCVTNFSPDCSSLTGDENLGLTKGPLKLSKVQIDMLNQGEIVSGIEVDGGSMDGAEDPHQIPVLLIPILHQIHLMGILLLEGFPNENAKDEFEVLTLKGYSVSLASAINRWGYEKELMLANIELKSKTEELIQSNSELEKFAWIISHDLTEPLRTVHSFTQFLEIKFGDLLDENGKIYLNNILKGTKKMKGLINDVLNYSQLGLERTEQVELVNLNTTLDNVLFELDSTIRATSGEVIRMSELPVLKIHTAFMHQVLLNLISNSFKYRSMDRTPRIEIDVKENGLYFLLSVSDNGIGIDMAFADKVFLPFQKLHGTNKYEGNGIGLSICKRIIEKLEGKIWIESIQDVGTTVYLKIPK